MIPVSEQKMAENLGYLALGIMCEPWVGYHGDGVGSKAEESQRAHPAQEATVQRTEVSVTQCSLRTARKERTRSGRASRRLLGVAEYDVL